LNTWYVIVLTFFKLIGHKNKCSIKIVCASCFPCHSFHQPMFGYKLQALEWSYQLGLRSSHLILTNAWIGWNCSKWWTRNEVNGWAPKIMDKTNEMSKCEKELNLAIRQGV
jgi:hypothetical protein